MMNLPAFPLLSLVLATCLPWCGLPSLQADAAPEVTAGTDLSSAAGQRWEFKPEGGDWKAIKVPAGGWRAQGYTCDAGTYRTTLTLPAYPVGDRVRLAFDAINFGAKISAGKDEASLHPIAEHVNGWLPINADLTPVASPSGSLLVQVEVAGRKKFMVNGKYTVPEGATWYPDLEEGILRGVHLEILPPVRIESAWVRTAVGPDVLHPEVTLVNDTAAPATVILASSVVSANDAHFAYPTIPGRSVTLPPQSTQTVDFGDIPWTAGPSSYWWPDVPYRADYRAQLHRLVFAVSVQGREVQRYTRRFGFRQFQAVADHYELNGIRCNLRGDNQQEANFRTDAYGTKAGFGPPTAGNPGWPQAVDNILRLNFNVMRIHQIPATSYMLDVCDERGLMLVEESPLRGSENGEDFKAGKANMLNMDRDLVLRDRNHPAVVIWSAANEWGEPIREASAVIRTVDSTRPIIADGVGEMGPDVINMQHYVSGMPGLPRQGGKFRTDRPYGETEAVWPADNTWQGFAWMGTGVLLRRLEGDADLRNYVLNNAWPNYVPGESPATEVLEMKVKHFGGSQEMHAGFEHPWTEPHIRLLQRCYHPLLACDIEFERVNALSNKQGDWPTARPEILTGTHVVREAAVFNDEFSGGEDLTLAWKALAGGKTGPVFARGEIPLHIPLGGFAQPQIAFTAPGNPGEVMLVLSVFKGGQERFTDDQTSFQVVVPPAAAGSSLATASPAPEVAPLLASVKGPALANQISHALDRPGNLVGGNGDISLMWSGTPNSFDLHFGKSDFWGVVRGNITTAGALRLTCRDAAGGAAVSRQNLGPATITGDYAAPAGGAALATTSWVAYPENLIVTELKNNGSAPLHFTSELRDGLGTPGLPSTSGANADSTFIQVSPDLVDFEVGNRLIDKVAQPFVGSIAAVQIDSPEYGNTPFLGWNPADPLLTRNVGGLQVTPGDVHGPSVAFTGVEDHRLILRGGCIPQSQFTFSAWVNPSQLNADGTVFAAIARESPNRFPYFRGFLVHLVNGIPEARLNYYTATGSAPLPAGQWSELKAVYKGQVLSLFVNGRQVAQGENPPASAQLGWDKCTLRTGDPALPFHGCAPQAILRQRIQGGEQLGVEGQKITFSVAPGHTARLLVSLVSDRNTGDYKKAAQALADCTPDNLAALRQAHDQWWHDFWSKSFVELPDQRIQANWYGSLYDLACCSRANCPPPGLWYNFITGMNAAWDGDYTLDYNYEAPFWAALATNHFELADSYDPLLLAHLSRGESIAQNAWRLGSAGQPGSLAKYEAQRNASLPPGDPNVFPGIYLYTHLIPLPGWSNDYGTFWNQKSNALFCTVNMVQRWRLTRNGDYAKKVYPFLKATADFWDHYLVLRDGRYWDFKDALAENSGDNVNPATTLSFLRLLYPSLIEISERLKLDADRRDKWHDILARLSPFTYVDASTVAELKDIAPDVLRDKKVIRDCESGGPAFPKSPYLIYHDRKERGSSPGMNCTQTIFPGWTFGVESPAAEREAALNTVRFAAEWYDGNNDCTFYPAAAAIGYDPAEILANLHGLIETAEQPNFTLKTGGGGTEDGSVSTAGLANMFVQSYQANIHVFPNWPQDQDAAFGDLPACGGFLVSSQQKAGKILYVRIVSTAGQTCLLANPWLGSTVKIAGTEKTLTGAVLKLGTSGGDQFILTPVH